MSRQPLVTFFVMLLFTLPVWADGWNELTDEERAWLKQHPVIRLGVDPQWPPFEYLDDGEYKGLAADYISLISERLGVKMVVTPNLTWPEVLKAARSRDVDLLPAAMPTGARRQYLEFTSTYLNFPMVIISQRKRGAVGGLSALRGSSVGVVNQYVSHELLKKNHPELYLVPTTTLAQGLEKLALGEIDYFVGNLASATYMIRKLGLTNLQVAAHTPYSFQLGMAVRKDWPELVSILNKSLMTISDRQHRAVQSSWFTLPTAVEERFLTFITIVLAVVAACVLMIIFSVVWIGRLRVEVSQRKKAEQALRQNETKLLDSQRIARIGSWQWCPDTHEAHWSDEVFRILGISKGESEFTFDNFLERVPRDDRTDVRIAIEQALDLGNRMCLEHRIMMDSGELRHVELQGRLQSEIGRLDGTIQDITERKRIELFFRGLSEDVAGLSGEKYFEAMVAFLCRSFGCSYAIIGKLLSDSTGEVRTLAVHANGKHLDNFNYLLENTPCENVIQNRACVYPQDVQQLFPNDQMLVEMGVESYAGVPLHDTAGQCVGVVVLLDDKPLKGIENVGSLLQITSTHVSAELQRQILVNQLQMTASVFENTREGILIANAERRVVKVNRGFTEITGFTESEVIGLKPDELFCTSHHDDRFIEQLWWQVNQAGSWQGEVWNRSQQGVVFPCLQSIEQVTDEEGVVQQYISVFTDITEQKRSEERIQYLAHYDVLTGLPNRILFNDRLKHAIERATRQESMLGVLFIDLDRFKYVNDTLGHDQGDNLLKLVATRLNACVRQADTVARLGGDEFTILLEDIERPDMLASIADKIQHSLNQPIDLSGHQAVVGCSIGLSVFPEDGCSSDLLLKHADTAMYSAKESGRNTYAFYSPELSQSSHEHFRLEQELRKAIEQQQLILHYQPLIDTDSDKVVTVEALVRWQRPDGELVSPGKFIPLAEETGLIVQMGEWILNSACAQARRWNKQGLDVKVAVNISGIQIMRRDFVDQVERMLTASGLSPALLELEVTESYVMNTSDGGVIEALTKLRELGVSISIDDFGTGYSSLSYLKQLPVDVLKIDRSFISDIPQDQDDEKIASAIIAMAKNLGLKVVAEGVETDQQMQFLQARGCDLAQGYYIARPMPPEEAEAFLARKRSQAYAIS